MNQRFTESGGIFWGVMLLAVLLAAAGCSHRYGAGAARGDFAGVAPVSSPKMQRFLESVRLKEEDAAYCYGLGRHFQRIGRDDLAVREFLRAARLAPLDAAVQNALGVSYDRLSNFQSAGRCYRKALILDPDFAAAYNNLGYSLLLQGRAFDAVAPLEKAVALSHDSALFRNNLAVAYQRTGRSGPADVQSAAVAPAEDPYGARPYAKEIYLPQKEKRDGNDDSLKNFFEYLSLPDSGRFGFFRTDDKRRFKGRMIVAKDRRGMEPFKAAGRLELVNGNGADQMARNLGKLLEEIGYIVEDLSNADHFDYPRTRIFYGYGERQEAGNLAEALLGAERRCDLICRGRADGRIRILIGKDLAELNDLLSGALAIQVANGNGVGRAAGKLSAYFSQKGFNVLRPVNAVHFNHPYTYIIYPEGRSLSAGFLLRQLVQYNYPRLVGGGRGQKSLRIVLGRDCNFDGHVKSRKIAFNVIPAKAGIY